MSEGASTGGGVSTEGVLGPEGGNSLGGASVFWPAR